MESFGIDDSSEVEAYVRQSRVSPCTSISGHSHSLDGKGFEPVLPYKQREQIFNNFIKFLCVRSQASGGTTQQSKDNALFKNSDHQLPGGSKASAFQVSFAHLSDSVSQHSRVSQSATHDFYGLLS